LCEMQSPFYQLKPKLYPDGNQWCALYGENIQDGLAGFGDTPAKAISDFDKNYFHQKIGEQTTTKQREAFECFLENVHTNDLWVVWQQAWQESQADKLEFARKVAEEYATQLIFSVANKNTVDIDSVIAKVEQEKLEDLRLARDVTNSRYSTDEIAEKFMVKPNSVRSSISRNGNYMGIKPIKLPNGLLAWPADEVDRIASGKDEDISVIITKVEQEQ